MAEHHPTPPLSDGITHETRLPPCSPVCLSSYTYSQVDGWCLFNGFLSSFSSKKPTHQHLSGADRIAMVVTNCLGIFCHKIKHFIEVVLK